MEHNLKTNLKLAGICATAMMTLSGCAAKYRNVIESVSQDSIFVKDLQDGKQRIIDFTDKDDRLLYSRVGDTIVFKESIICLGHYKKTKYLVHGFDGTVEFSEKLLIQRKPQTNIDSVRYSVMDIKQELQR